jgi:hypothetical protein
MRQKAFLLYTAAWPMGKPNDLIATSYLRRRVLSGQKSAAEQDDDIRGNRHKDRHCTHLPCWPRARNGMS